MTELPKTYSPKAVEDGIYKKWEDSGFFNPDNLEKASDRYWKAEPFSIVMPPANVTAELHLGSAMFLTIQDLIIRHARMQGRKTLWLPGTDHAAIATQNVVERKIWEQEKKTRHDLGREELLRRIEDFVKQTRERIQQQIRKMGASCDWSREKYTLSPELSVAVRTVFKKMYDTGLIYRGNRIVNWCPRCGTTLADDEVTYKSSKGQLYYIRYPLIKTEGALTVATTRPETMLGDTAVAVHPQDPRYKKYIGQDVMLPLLNRKLPVIADQKVDRTFGTGVLKVTPGHDPQDFEIGQQHNLEIINLFTLEGKINEAEAFDHGFEDYANLTIAQAREKIIQELNNNGFLEKTEELNHNVGFCYRCGTMVEPLVLRQWFVNVNLRFPIKNQGGRRTLKLPAQASLKEIATAAVKSGSIKIVPERFVKTYAQWMENLRDWNISRQIWFGHRIPVWYCGAGGQTALQEEMGFYDSVVPQVFAGKTKTYRLRDHHLKLGDQLNFKNTQTGKIFGIGAITNIEQTVVAQINLEDPDHVATYDRREQLIERLKFHNPGAKVTNETHVFIYTYKFTPTTPTAGCGEIVVAVDPPQKCPHCGKAALVQDSDTLDTWFSSSLWTFSTLGWPEETADLATFHPTTILETGYDILFFWVARMVIMTGFTLEQIPFHTVYLHGLVQDFAGKKMSKSRGNAINPLTMIEKYGTDALRLSLILGTTPGNDTKIYEAKIETHRNFVNKLWNIARFILPANGNPPIIATARQVQTLADQWILNKLDSLIANLEKNLNNYQFGLAGEALLNFTRNDFADWYVEIAKIEKNKNEILLHILQTLLRLWHPFIPFITEAIWSRFSKNLLMIEEYPARQKGKAGKVSIVDFDRLQNLIVGLRNLRSEYRLPAAATFAVYLEVPKTAAWIKKQTAIIENLARVKLNFEKMDETKKMPFFLWESPETVKVYLIVPDFDPHKELKLAEKDLKQTNEFLGRLEKQLTKKEFLKKAPPEIVSDLQTKFAETKQRRDKLQAKINSLQ